MVRCGLWTRVFVYTLHNRYCVRVFLVRMSVAVGKLYFVLFIFRANPPAPALLFVCLSMVLCACDLNGLMCIPASMALRQWSVNNGRCYSCCVWWLHTYSPCFRLSVLIGSSISKQKRLDHITSHLARLPCLSDYVWSAPGPTASTTSTSCTHALWDYNIKDNIQIILCIVPCIHIAHVSRRPD